MAQRVHLHVGTPKSGTTYLQAALWEHRDALRERGLLVPGRRPFDHNRASSDVRRGRHLDGGADGRAWARLCREVADFDGAAVLSNEWYVEATEARARAAVEQLGVDVEVVITTRNLVRLVPAAWQESLKIGRGHTLREFVERLEDPDVRWHWGVLDPSLVARRWAGIVGAEHVHVVTVPEESPDRTLLWRRFTETLGVDVDDLAAPGRRANESLSVQATRLLQEVGPQLRAETDRHDASWRGHARWMRNTVVREVLVDVPGDPIGVGPELRETLLSRTAAAVADLQELGCRVTGDLEELLPGTDRPGARHPEEVTSGELVEAAGHLSAGLLRSRIEAEEKQHRQPAAAAAPAPGPRETTRGRPSPGEAVARARGRLADSGRRSAHTAGALVARAGTRAAAAAARRAPSPRGRTRRVTFMVPSAYYAGGIARTVFTCANTLAARGYDVGVITLTRSAEAPYFDVDPRIRVIAVQDRFDPENPDTLRPRVRNDPEADPQDRQLDRQPSTLAEETHKTFTGYVDARLREELSALPPGVVVSTRPEFAVAAARWCDPRSILLHQEHLSFLPRPAVLRRALRDLALGTGGQRPVDALLTLTEADLERWQEFLSAQPGQGGNPLLRTGAIPNPTPFAVGDPAPLTSKVIIAAGRFTAQKGFERLVDAFAPLTESHPDWQLRIYGTGQQHDRIATQVADLGVGDRILLPGVTNEFEQELGNAAVYAMSSRYEGLPMVLLEALSKGVPPVSFDCPEGPRQLIEDERNGLLVPEGDVPALTDALRRVMDDEDLRRRLGAGALATARDYQADAVVDRWVDLIEDVDRSRRAAGR